MLPELPTEFPNTYTTEVSDNFRSVPVPKNSGRFRRFLAYAGPGFLISVGYMDPGNWATDLEGGSKFGYRLLWIIFLSNAMAILLQTLCVRLGLATGKDLAQACREYYKRPAVIALWLLCEVAIIACDLAEVIGSAVALNLLSGNRIPLVFGVLLTGLDVLLLLGLSHFGFRKIEAIILTLVGTVAGCFALEVFLARPDWSGVFSGMTHPTVLRGEELTIAVGIIGATVMPHNLYLHSALVKTRAHDESETGIQQAIGYNTLDTVISLGAAFFVNAAILILAAAAFHLRGNPVTELGDAYHLLTPLLGGAASTLFAVALLASGQSSTITGTLAGQIVMEGFIQLRVSPWLRRIVTRGLAVIPAVLLLTVSGGKNVNELLVWSQVILSMQLSFAIFPLMSFTSDRTKMRDFVNPPWLRFLGYFVCGVIALLNLRLLWETCSPLLLAFLFLLSGAFSLWVRFGYSAVPPGQPSKPR